MTRKSVQGPHYHSTIATNLRALVAHEAGGSVNAWAKARGIRQSTLNSISNGTMDTKLSTAQAIADACGRPLSDLVSAEFDAKTRARPRHGVDARLRYYIELFASITDPRHRTIAEATLENLAPHPTPQADESTSQLPQRDT